MSNLKNKLIKLGSQKPELQKHIKPVLDKISGAKVPKKYRNAKKKFQDAVLEVLKKSGPMKISEVADKVIKNSWDYDISDDKVEFLKKNKGSLLKDLESKGKIERDGVEYKLASQENDLKEKLVRLGSKNSDLQKHIKPVLDKMEKNSSTSGLAKDMKKASRGLSMEEVGEMWKKLDKYVQSVDEKRSFQEHWFRAVDKMRSPIPEHVQQSMKRSLRKDLESKGLLKG